MTNVALGIFDRPGLSASEPRSLRANRSFVLFCAGNFCSNLGGWMQTGAIPYIVYQMTHDVGAVGVAGLVSFLPSMLAALPGGALADRFHKPLFLCTTQLMLALVTIPLCVTAATGNLTMGVLLLFLALQSALLGLSVPALQTLGPELVVTRLTAAAINVNSGQAQIAKAIGPAIAGFTLARYGAVWAFTANAASYVAAAATVFAIRKQSLSVQSATRKRAPSLVRSLRSTWNHSSRRLIVLLIGMAMFLGAPLYQFIAVICDSRLHSGAGAYGVLVGLYGVGAVLGNILRHRMKAPASQVMTAGLIVYAASIAVTASSASFIVCAIAVVVAGCCYLLISVTLMTAIQLVTPRSCRASVIGVYSFAYVGGVPLGNLAQGWVAERAGVTATLLIAAAGLAAVAGFLLLRPDVAVRIDGELADEVIYLRAAGPVPTTATRPQRSGE